MKHTHNFFVKPDQNFDLMTISNEELFYALKNAVVCAINELPEREMIEGSDIFFYGENATRRKAYGKDENLYPLIVLPFGVRSYLGVDDFYLMLNSFEVSIISTQNRPQIITNKNLSRVFDEYMQSRFPESDYVLRKEKYFEMAKMLKKVEEGNLFI